MAGSPYHVFTKHGDARAEVDELVRGLGGDAAEAGLHKAIFVSRANQTVVMLRDPEAPLAGLLRGRKGWHEPAQ